MRKLLLLFCLCTAIYAPAQERIPQSFSFSVGHLLTKGIQVSGHYHINTFDEYRLSFSHHQKTYRIDSLANLETIPILRQQRWTLNYIKGFRFRQGSMNNVGVYLGSGISYGKEQLSTDNLDTRVIGIQFLVELDIALARKLSLFLNVREHWLFTNHHGKNGAMGIGLRGYF